MVKVQTQNTQWGFYGTVKQYGLSDKMAAELFSIIADRLHLQYGVSLNQARDYLDATHGRHLADALSFYGAKQGSSKKVMVASINAYFENCKDHRHVKKFAQEEMGA